MVQIKPIKLKNYTEKKITKPTNQYTNFGFGFGLTYFFIMDGNW